MNRRRSVHECMRCPHLASSHRLVNGAPIEGPYRCLFCDCETVQSEPTRLISLAQAQLLHADEIRRNSP